MRSSGVTFWWFPDEENAFLHYLRSTGDVLAIYPLVASTPDAFAPLPLLDSLRQSDPDKVLFGPAHFARRPSIIVKDVDAERRYFVSSITSSLVAYQRGRIRSDDSLGQSNLYAYWAHLNEAGTDVFNKDPQFRRWAEKVLRWVRKATPDWHQYKGYRVSPRVKDAIVKERVKIVV